MVIKIDRAAVVAVINEKHPKRIVFNAPDGLLAETRAFSRDLESEFGLEAIVIEDPTYGSCDTVDIDAQRLGADVAFHVGHNVIVKKFGKITYSIDAIDDVNFDSSVPKLVDYLRLKQIDSVGLVTFAQHVQELQNVSKSLESKGISTVIGKGMGQLHDGQIFGCEFYPAFNIKDRVGGMVLLGQSMFHAIGLSLSTGKPTFMVDPYASEVIDMEKTAQERLKRAVLSIYMAKDAKRFGVIIGLKEGQIMADQSVKIKKELENLGKEVQLIALREITANRINSMTEIEAFVQTGCPRISVDGYNFSKPVLSVPQVDALIDLLSGKEINMGLFERKHWL